MTRQLYTMANSLQFPSNGWVDGPQPRSGHFREETPVASSGNRIPVRPVRRFVTILSSVLRSSVGCISIHPLCSEPTPPRSIIFLFVHMKTFWGKRWRSWLRHRATRRKVAISIPDVVIGILH
jgi:hypothetical protein